MANQEMYKHDAMLHIVWVVAVEDRKDEAEKWATPEEDNYLDTIRKAEDINICNPSSQIITGRGKPT